MYVVAQPGYQQLQLHQDPYDPSPSASSMSHSHSSTYKFGSGVENVAASTSQQAVAGPSIGFTFKPYPTPSPSSSPPGQALFSMDPVFTAAQAEDEEGDTSRGPRVPVACTTCRRRKTRCDGLRPICSNCARRDDRCEYEAQPKRRGPDKMPGTRVRSVYSRRLVLERGGVLPEPGGKAREKARERRERERKREERAEREREEGRGRARGELVGERLVKREEEDGEDEVTRHAMRQKVLRDLHVEDPAAFRRGSAGVSAKSETSSSISPTSPAFGYAYGSFSAAPEESHVTAGAQNARPFSGYGRSQGYITEIVDETSPTGKRHSQDTRDLGEIPPQPSMDFHRRTWWDSLLDMYTNERSLSIQQVRVDIAYVFSFSPYMISFFNVPLFWSTFHSPSTRDALQPSLVFSLLAFATFMRSSELEAGAVGRRRALQLATIARAYFQASIDSGWVDGGLAQAAFVLTLFEMCPHEEYGYARLTSSFWALDGVLAALWWTSLDVYDDQAVIFAAGFVPSAPSPPAIPASASPTSASSSISPTSPSASVVPFEQGGPCGCTQLSLISSPSALVLTPFWSTTPTWDPTWPEPETRKEEARRLVWNTVNLMSGHTSLALAFGERAADFWCTRPEKFALLFPGEVLARSPAYAGHFSHNPRDSVWAVYGRLALLYGACWRYFAYPTSADGALPPASSPLASLYPSSCAATKQEEHAYTFGSESDKAEFAYAAWMETLKLEDLLNRHVCAGERSTLFQGREFLFKIRVMVSRDYRNYFPFPETGIDMAFHHRKAEQWLSHQAILAFRLMEGLNSVTGMGANDLRLRPFFLWYFALQSQRCLSFHTIDPSLTVALDVAAAWMMPVDYLVQIWPCANMDAQLDMLRRRIRETRLAAGMPPVLAQAQAKEMVMIDAGALGAGLAG